VLAIKDARVLSMNEAGSFEKATVVVDGDSIVELGENPSLAQDCELIHASGKYLLPGFIDSHNHIGLEEEIYRIEGSDVNEIADPITPQLRALDGINFWDLAFTDALRGGVTRSLTMPGSANLIGGQAVFLKHLAARPADMVYKHPWGLKAALGENPKRVYAEQKKSPITRMANASLLREALYTAARNMDRVDRTASEVFKQDPLQKVLKQEMPLLASYYPLFLTIAFKISLRVIIPINLPCRRTGTRFIFLSCIIFTILVTGSSSSTLTTLVVMASLTLDAVYFLRLLLKRIVFSKKMMLSKRVM
jgi:imidazolonepropionase-like amidohydrolase